jgi:hypothetical protein
MVRIERHVFGSFKGYTTLAASPGIGADESRLLEGASFGFGQSGDKRYLKSLRSTPAYFTRSLRGRRGVTRVFEGASDDNGRPTLLMITCVVGQREWDAELCGDVGLLLNEKSLWEWTPAQQQKIAAVEMNFPSPLTSVSRKSAAKVAALLSEVERRFGSGNGGGGITVAAGELSLDEMRALEILVPPQARGQFTSGYRALGAQLPVTVNALAAEAPVQQLTFSTSNGGSGGSPPSRYVSHLLASGLADGKLPVGEAMTYRGFGAGATRADIAPAAPLAPPPPASVPRDKRPILPLAAGGAALLAIGFGGGFFFGTRHAATDRSETGHATAAVAVTQPATVATTAPATVAAVPATQPTSEPVRVAASQRVSPPASAAVAGSNPTSQPIAVASTNTPPSIFATTLPSIADLEAKRKERAQRLAVVQAQYREFVASVRKSKSLSNADVERFKDIAAVYQSTEGAITRTEAEEKWLKEVKPVVEPLQKVVENCEKFRVELQAFADLRRSKMNDQAAKRLSAMQSLRDGAQASMEAATKALEVSQIGYWRLVEVQKQCAKAEAER